MFFFFNDTATAEIYTLSLHDALPIWKGPERKALLLEALEGTKEQGDGYRQLLLRLAGEKDRKSTRLNSSHANTSYAAFCLKKKKLQISTITYTHSDLVFLHPLPFPAL